MNNSPMTTSMGVTLFVKHKRRSIQMEKPNDIKRDSISVNYFLNAAAYSGLFSLLSVILTGQVSAASSLYVGLALGILSLFSRGSTVFIGSLIERFSTVSLTETGFGFMVFSLLLLQPAMGGFIGFLFADLALLGLGLSLVNFALRGHIIATVKDKKIQASLFALVTMPILDPRLDLWVRITYIRLSDKRSLLQSSSDSMLFLLY